MSSPFQGIDTARTALIAFQRALDVTGQNVANVDTPGYSRQQVDFATNDPSLIFQNKPVWIGNGVNIASVTRVQDAFLQQRKLAAGGDLGRSTSLAANLSQIQSLIPEPGSNGISAGLDQFFNAWSALSSNPNDPGSRVQVQQAGATLAQRIQSTYLSLQGQKTQTQGQVTQTFQDINALTAKIATLNQKIEGGSLGNGSPNDLLDQRDQAIAQLSQLVDVKTYTFSNGATAVYMNQLTLVDGSGSYPIPTSYDLVKQTVTNGSSVYNVNTGKLAGLFQTLNAIGGYAGKLDALANNLRTQVNAIHKTGINPLGGTGLNFFNDVASGPQTGAIDFALDPAIAADPQAIASSVTGVAGDGGLALALSRTRDTQVAALGNATFGSYYSSFVSSVGRDTATASTTKDTQTAISKQVDNQIQSVSGVSLDDEMANLLRYQRSYQAAAKALSIFDQTTQDLLGILK